MGKQKQCSIYERMQRFSDITLKLIQNRNMDRANKCLAIADRLFATGTVQMKNAITVVYLFKLSVVLESHYYNVAKLLPGNLKREYLRISSLGL